MIRRALAMLVIVNAFGYGVVGGISCKTLTPAEEAQVARDGVQLGTCAAIAHMCKLEVGDASRAPCWSRFDECMVAHGFQDAGAE